jgi:branched-chain amino acid transport system permease protein
VIVGQQVVNAVALAGIYLLFALGLTLAWGTAKILNLAHASIFMFSAFIAYQIGGHSGLSLAVVLPAAALGGGLLGLVAELAAFRPIRRRIADPHQAEMAMLIASVGVSSILIGVVQNVTNSEVLQIPTSVFTVSPVGGSAVHVTNLQILVLGTAVVVTALLAYWVRATRTGRALRGIAYSAQTSSLLGINSDLLVAGTMFVSGLLAGLAGVLLVLNFNALDAHIGDPLLLKAFSIIVLGGVGSIAGTVIGATLLAFTEIYVAAYISTSLQDAIAFLFILAVLLIRPEGLFGRARVERA